MDLLPILPRLLWASLAQCLCKSTVLLCVCRRIYQHNISMVCSSIAAPANPNHLRRPGSPSSAVNMGDGARGGRDPPLRDETRKVTGGGGGEAGNVCAPHGAADSSALACAAFAEPAAIMQAVAVRCLTRSDLTGKPAGGWIEKK